MTTIRMPGLIDAHVHIREPGYEQKETLATGTRAALAGGVTAVLDMPNTLPPTATPELLADKVRRAEASAFCDVGFFVGATSDHLDAYLPAATRACGLKIYVSDTFGSLRIDSLELMHRFFRTWAEKAEVIGYRSADNPTGIGPVAVHAEELMLPVCLNLSKLYEVPLHIVHVSRRSEIELIRRAKECDHPVTCEVTPHHLFLTTDDAQRLGPLGDMRPRLATPDDVTALWENLAVVDIFATDHAPHTLEEKALETPPPGVPGVETMLPLLLTAVHHGKLTLGDITTRCKDNPQRIYGIPEQVDTYIEVDLDAEYVITNEAQVTKCGWTPFAGQTVFGRVERTVLRGETVYAHGEILVTEPGGQILFNG